jgi:hypothetical protein
MWQWQARTPHLRSRRLIVLSLAITPGAAIAISGGLGAVLAAALAMI